ncbi:hypothetical protein GCM10025771_15810 [Niveibacterium umoris]|uniref:Pimeloyl-ACP methyl ester carboxylesterase n=1 Tax=Niveibacterium umoris TaxID=1193620 RepID=A0A840BT18_9RHOO|nr:alpha/beta fold hydrolase [Niveibacterium umoris]MBB4014549.1 pimeloyl-ACP methyl ester carboxylesterase [Niveibacterium umoris]
MDRRTCLIGGGLLAAGAATAALGPRPDGRIDVHPPTLPDDLDAWLASTEARYPDLIPGAEKRIVRAPGAGAARRPFSLVYLHGFSASRQETSPLVEDLGAQLGADAFFTRIAGHGRSDAAMGEATLSDWVESGLEAVAIGERLGERTILVGTSTGATLALWLAATGRAPTVAALVLMSPNLGPRDAAAETLLWPWVAKLAPGILGEWHSWTPANPEQARLWKTRYPLAGNSADDAAGGSDTFAGSDRLAYADSGVLLTG